MVDENITAEQNLERRLGELESIVSLLEDGSISINEAIAKYSEGMNIALECQRNLNILADKVSQAREEAQRAFNRLKQEEAQEHAEWMSKQQAEQAQPNLGAMPPHGGGVPPMGFAPQSGPQGAFKMPPNNQMPPAQHGVGPQGMPQGQQGQSMPPQGTAPQGTQGGFQARAPMSSPAAPNFASYPQQGSWGANSNQQQQQQQQLDNSRNSFGGAPSSDSDVPF